MLVEFREAEVANQACEGFVVVKCWGRCLPGGFRLHFF
jgi:hypothetical protein